MAALGVPTDGAAVRRVEAHDETRHKFLRYFTQLPGVVEIGASPLLTVSTPRVMFQDIIHDGLIGDDFLRRYTVTFDLAHSRLIFGPR